MQYEPGQEVAVQVRNFDRTMVRGIVQHVTRAGQVTVALDEPERVTRFDRTGREIGVKYNADRLIGPWTQEIADASRRRELIDKLSAAKWPTLPLATLERVAAALDQPE